MAKVFILFKFDLQTMLRRQWTIILFPVESVDCYCVTLLQYKKIIEIFFFNNALWSMEFYLFPKFSWLAFWILLKVESLVMEWSLKPFLGLLKFDYSNIGVEGWLIEIIPCFQTICPLYPDKLINFFFLFNFSFFLCPC